MNTMAKCRMTRELEDFFLKKKQTFNVAQQGCVIQTPQEARSLSEVNSYWCPINPSVPFLDVH